MLPKLARIAWLYDFYGQLLTGKQREWLELYYHHDLSLGEIASEHGVSRQAVYDTLRRGEKLLENYENKLGLLSKHLARQSSLNQLAALINEELATSREEETLAKARALVQDMLTEENQ